MYQEELNVPGSKFQVCARRCNLEHGTWNRPLTPLRFFVLLVSLWLSPAGAQVQAQGYGSRPDVVAQVDSILKDAGLAGGFQGVVIESLKDGSVWYERNADLMFMPASNEKLLTSAATLNALGPDWRYVTKLLRAGTVDTDGSLSGDLILKGSGDPLLDDKDLDSLVEAVRAAGIRRIEGRVLGDDSRFDHQRYGDGWAWDDMSYYYSAQVSGLNLDENVVTVKMDPGRRAGDRIRLSESPTDRYLALTNRARTAKAGEKTALSITRELGRNRATVAGVLALDARPEDHKPDTVTVEDPALFAATVLTGKLRKAGIAVGGRPAAGIAPMGAVEVARHESPPLPEILKRMNKPSDNLAAECLLKTLGAEKGEAGSDAAGREVAYAWFKQLGFNMDGVAMTDGSGLSRQTFVSPRNLAILLRAMYTHPQSRVYIDSLPIAGVDGTLRNRMKGTPAEGNCRAKTGYISAASSISGYVTTKAGETLLFVMLMNNHRARNAVPMVAQNKIVVYLASHGP